MVVMMKEEEGGWRGGEEGEGERKALRWRRQLVGRGE